MADDCLQWEPLGPRYRICVTKAHRFGTDAFLLAAFASSRSGELACDLGSGCGIIPMLWLRGEHPPKMVYAVELMAQAVAQMRKTVAENALEDRLIPVEADLIHIDSAGLPRCGFDLVACNPPYKPAGHGVPSPDQTRLAARHEVSCSIGDVCRAAAGLLRYGGRFCLCNRPERLPDVFSALREHGLEPKRLRFVQQRPAAAPWLFLAEARKGGRPFLQVEPPLIIEASDGSFSPELLKIYGQTPLARHSL